MDFSADLAAFYVDFGETVTVAGSPITAIFSGGFAAIDGVAGTRPLLRCRAADVAAVSVGTAIVRGSTNYVVRGIEQIPPDEVEVLLVLERV